jgi:hypothetical protein
MRAANPIASFGLVARKIATAVSGLQFVEGLRDQTYPAPPGCKDTGKLRCEGKVPAKRSPLPKAACGMRPDGSSRTQARPAW